MLDFLDRVIARFRKTPCIQEIKEDTAEVLRDIEEENRKLRENTGEFERKEIEYGEKVKSFAARCERNGQSNADETSLGTDPQGI